jgi:hypothetical protein
MNVPVWFDVRLVMLTTAIPAHGDAAVATIDTSLPDCPALDAQSDPLLSLISTNGSNPLA